MAPEPESEPLLRTEDVARMCHTSPGTVHYWRHNKKGPKAIKVGRRLLFRRSDVEEWMGRFVSDPEAR